MPVSSETPARSSLSPGTLLDGLEIVQCSGVSATGFVYSARDRRSGRMLTVREYMPMGLAQRLHTEVVPRAGAQPAFEAGLRRFYLDAQRLQRVAHPSLVAVERLSQQGGTAYLVMPAYAGRGLYENFGAVPPTLHARRVESWLRGVSDAMAALHREANLPHGAVKPSRLFINEEGRLVLGVPDGARWKIAEAVPSALNVRSPWLAPEQLHGGVLGPWTDIYALGAVAYWLLSGQAPTPARERLPRGLQPTLASLAGATWPKPWLQGIEASLSLDAGLRPRTIEQWLEVMGLCDRRSRRRVPGESLLLQSARSSAPPRPPAPPQWLPPARRAA
jgi:serine/threonine protein kinase